jgi:hypothetical protein
MISPPVGFPPPESWRVQLVELFDLVAQQFYPYLRVQRGDIAVIIIYKLPNGIALYANSYYPYNWQYLSAQMLIPYVEKELTEALELLRQEAVGLQGELEKFQAKVAF